MLAEIKLPTGSNQIRIGDIPKLFADAIHPAVESVRLITKLQKLPITEGEKKRLCGNISPAFPVSLEEQDWEILSNGAWSNLPSLQLPIPESQWQPYLEALQTNPPSQDWQLCAHIDDQSHIQLISAHYTKDEYKKAVAEAARKGEITPRSYMTLMPVPHIGGASLEDCFITLEELRRFANRYGVEVIESELPNNSPQELVRGITKQQVVNAFEGLHFSRDQWNKYLADTPDWLKECRVMPGVQGKKVSATWNPVLIAAALIDKGVSPKKLDAVFVRLPDWAEEWQETSDRFRE